MGAKLANSFRDMRGQDKAPVSPFFEQFLMATLLKALITDRNNFINQITIEVECHG